MNYEIKIDNAKEEKGTIDLHRLALIADSIRKVSEGALKYSQFFRPLFDKFKTFLFFLFRYDTY
ncbi:hypothetical protein QA597_09210 [Marinilabiliaceae bacterium ANBcel2]|nr:hypothetical protein [Marinilabiliaceae bacterium ANBcel2]